MSSIEKYWRGLVMGIRSVVFSNTENRLQQLARQHPRHCPLFDPLAWAHRCIAQAAAMIGRADWDDAPGSDDAQALRSYATGVAIGFYGVEARRSFASSPPSDGSKWSQEQLHRLQSLGLEHGRYIRDASANRQNLPG
ncbi:hypothetical protein [Burkholderia gladioli]|uniref:hypothetical protein n=1 Tax=Burkholderia gladioli TaxID=28095 RepID=UPI001C233B6E|nr:hypothetical protein [Burkholderia gladioli]MBU9685665.1 hypothetical protein [Burkholderia gladioli]MDD1785759.1 hypothetical protein [Burkholderia gladioli]